MIFSRQGCARGALVCGAKVGKTATTSLSTLSFDLLLLPRQTFLLDTRTFHHYQMSHKCDTSGSKMASNAGNAPRPLIPKACLDPHVLGRFEYFPFAPVELRTIIWQLAAQAPEVIAVTMEIRNCGADVTTAKGKRDHGWHKRQSKPECNRPCLIFNAINDGFGFILQRN